MMGKRVVFFLAYWALVIFLVGIPLKSEGQTYPAADLAMRSGNFEDAVQMYANRADSFQSSGPIDSAFYYKARWWDARQRAGALEGLEEMMSDLVQGARAKVKSPEILSFILTTASWISSRMGAPDQSLEWSEEAQRVTPSPIARASAMVAEATVRSQRQEFRKVEELLLRAIDLLENNGVLAGKDLGIALFNLGITYDIMDDRLKSAESKERAFQLLLDYYAPGHPNYLLIKVQYADVLMESGRWDQSLDLLEECLSSFRQQKDTSGIMLTMDRLALNHVKMGDYTSALKELRLLYGYSYEQGLQMTYNHASILGSLISNLRDTERWDEAEEYLDELFALCEADPGIREWQYTTALTTQALLASDRGNFEYADSIFEVLEEEIPKVYGEESENISYNHFFRGDNYMAMGAYDLALQQLGQSLDYYRENEMLSSYDVAYTYVIMGRAYREMGEKEMALENYLKARDLYNNSFGDLAATEAELVELHPVVGRDELYRDLIAMIASWEGGAVEFEESLQWLEEAKTYFHYLQSAYSRVSETEYIIEMYKEIGAGAQKIFLDAYEQQREDEFLWEGLEWAEQSKTYVRRILLNDRRAKKYAQIPEHLLKRDIEFRNQYQFHQKLLTEMVEPEQKKEVVFRLHQIQDDWDLLIDSLEEQYPRYYQLKYAQNSATAADIRGWAEEKGVDVLYYFETDSGLFRYWVKDQTIRAHFDMGVSRVDSLVYDLRDAMEENRPKDYYAAATDLYELLWPDIPDGTPGEFCIIPDGSLCYLNFETLVRPAANPPAAFREMDFLIEDYAIFYRYELSTLFENRAYPSEPGEWQVYIPEFDSQQTEVAPLPWTSEVTSFFQENIAAKIYLREQASIEGFEKNAQKASLLHFSTHGVVNAQRPMESFLYLSRKGNQPDSLTALEILGIDMQAQLAVLSACQTGIGEYKVGWGLQSLAWAFEYAGCKNFLASLWSIDDQASADLMTHFYEQLNGVGTSTPIPGALKNAKLAVLQSEKVDFSNPYYWGGLLYIGDLIHLEVPPHHFNGAGLIWGLMIFILVLLVWRYVFREKLRDRQER